MNSLADGAFVVRHASMQITIVRWAGVAVSFRVELPKGVTAFCFYRGHLAKRGARIQYAIYKQWGGLKSGVLHAFNVVIWGTPTPCNVKVCDVFCADLIEW